MAFSFRFGVVCAFLSFLYGLGVWAYIPASPTNSSTGVAGGPNISDVSMLYLEWYMGSYSETVSYQLVGNGSNGVSQGALVHFSEEMSWNNETTTTPWIALVACDKNATNASQVDDIFTLARDRGAKAALLYSEYSQACVINPDYANPENFEQVMDIFSTQSLTSAKLIEYQFNSSAINKTLYGNYNASLLNASAAIINNTMSTGLMNVSSFMFAELKAYNATGTGAVDGGGGDTPTGSTSAEQGSGSNRNSSLAMIILYAITGCVSSLFCVVIITGAIRAIRHPERYGPRMGDFNGRGSFTQSRAQGLGRAILDTFPVVKFGQNNNRERGQDSTQDTKDIELGEAPALSHTGRQTPGDNKDAADERRVERSEGGHEALPASQDGEDAEQSQASTSRVVPTRRPSGRARPAEDVVPDVIGRETCPICILDFEEGDDLRVLPCEGKHMFHKQCVDPWLLELSSSCPICRHDFHALETMMQGEGHGPPHDFHQNHRDSSGGGNRFSRYLRSAIRRRRYREEAAGYDPTDPYMPYAPETGL
ncbi:hypothetical protein GLOTRDRAFT_58432 [Gloeophyllum trabeum ATCC 11539]|uniref:RING-type domain-containing protein n=1 Tax=Gloeophyllum trabeum (strain ATCC 11539 / FP-39264 / Madison 617) TaxID=670483 RepID=S7RVE9_GLOTA|nr:uncharacterized protein GLOTRDRAFT_58432 [Gloeophyllum trabeum ATCC 11539]EPQ57224.1 hypothetical protein GLOTRDRAFT_58432 [Gloeophyllum trabeum ATCC 11539]